MVWHVQPFSPKAFAYTSEKTLLEKLSSCCNARENCDLRFETETEAAYVSSLQRGVLVNGLPIILMLLVSIPGALLPVIWRETHREDIPLLSSPFDIRHGVILFWIFNFVVLFNYAILNVLSITHCWFRSWKWEYIFLMTVTYHAVSLAFGNFWHMPLLAGLNPVDVWEHDPRGTDVFILLAMDGLMTAVAMYVPVRSCVLWILMLTASVSYVLLTLALESVFPADIHLTISAIVGLTALAYHGAHKK
ncbi:unnamed protein product, partial [Polarella glacialis]